MFACSRLLAALLIVVCVPSTLAEPSKTVFLEELTWTELRDRLKAGSTTIIVPIGGTEQNGPAMVLGKHNRRVRLLAERVANGLGHTLVAPVNAYVPEGSVDPPTAHMRFPGTITIPEAAFESTLEYAARSFRRHGFRDIVLIGDHGSYQKNMRHVADKLNREWASGPARVHALDDYYHAFDVEYPQALRAKGFTQQEVGTHAGLADTSLSMALDPQMVRTERLHESNPATSEGVYGDPSRSSVQAGRLGVELIVGRTIEAIKRRLARR